MNQPDRFTATNYRSFHSQFKYIFRFHLFIFMNISIQDNIYASLYIIQNLLYAYKTICMRTKGFVRVQKVLYAYKRFCTRTTPIVRVLNTFVRVQHPLYAYKTLLYAYKTLLYAYKTFCTRTRPFVRVQNLLYAYEVLM